MALGTALVLIFSDPMVDVMSNVGERVKVPRSRRDHAETTPRPRRDREHRSPRAEGRRRSCSQVPPFYVAFVLAPLASNASELIASVNYASKKSKKTITVALAALEGAACMNNTFCLAIFMGLIFFQARRNQSTLERVSSSSPVHRECIS